MHIPKGYGTVFPYFLVNDAQRFVEFLQNVFDAKEVGRTVAPDGRIRNVRMGIGTSNFMLSEVPADSTMSAAYYVYVPDADATFARALAHGATKIMDVMDMPYQDRQGGVTDPWGNKWWISTRLVADSYD